MASNGTRWNGLCVSVRFCRSILKVKIGIANTLVQANSLRTKEIGIGIQLGWTMVIEKSKLTVNGVELSLNLTVLSTKNEPVTNVRFRMCNVNEWIANQNSIRGNMIVYLLAIGSQNQKVKIWLRFASGSWTTDLKRMFLPAKIIGFVLPQTSEKANLWFSLAKVSLLSWNWILMLGTKV